MATPCHTPMPAEKRPFGVHPKAPGVGPVAQDARLFVENTTLEGKEAAVDLELVVALLELFRRQVGVLDVTSLHLKVDLLVLEVTQAVVGDALHVDSGIRGVFGHFPCHFESTVNID
jgi:hypothetical protein